MKGDLKFTIIRQNTIHIRKTIRKIAISTKLER